MKTKHKPSRSLLRYLRRSALGVALAFMALTGAQAQILRDIVSWTRTVEDNSPTEKTIVLTASIKPN